MSDPQLREAHLRKARLMVTGYGQRGPYRTNPDPQVVVGPIEALARQWDRFGLMFCPCRPLSGDLNQDRQNIYPCAWHRGETVAWAVRGRGKCV